ncbi:4Fe-4S binding protein [Neobacillus notoginsengisoli]|uniref:4Fe-4S binding protein n=1 Tax=Neobacillus notoginsengisoli TaxID=1578198 RepID=A0A417YW02_9BACI|nr:4Fe-4S binding protein [Neobacillus notoginsengisoli]RHW41526.1 4Fe-4S binding protein [Neobacillus notoginsengisoli]
MAVLKKYYKRVKRHPIQYTRMAVQIVFALFLLFIGVRFYQFYMHFNTMGLDPLVPRPPAVEGFLPISALVALKVWITTGIFDPIHPAGLALFTFFIASGFIFRKAFCGWMCPIGTLSEWIGRLGKKLFKWNFDVPKWLKWILTPIKYLLLFLFLFMVLTMPTMGAIDFMAGNYNKVSDVKMMLFFLNVGGIGLTVILVLVVLSLFVKNFWCRFLCPYGALIGLGSVFGITKIRRNADTCIDCNACTKVCPQRITVSKVKTVKTPDCTACMSCVEVCPVKDTLNMTVATKKVNKWVIPAAFFATFFIVIAIAKLTGNWHTMITYEEWRHLIPNVYNVGH